MTNNHPSVYAIPTNGAREVARRVRQIAAGQLTVNNGLHIEVKKTRKRKATAGERIIKSVKSAQKMAA